MRCAHVLLPATAVPAAAATPEVTCYRARAARGGPAFTRRTLPLDDRFGSRRALVRKPDAICNPATTAGDDDGDGAQLACYAIADADRQAPPVGRTVEVATRLGPETLAVRRPRALCVPSTPARAPASPAAALLDVLSCYRVKPVPGAVGGSRPILVLSDRFGATTARVLRPRLLCNAAGADGEASADPDAQLVCYAIRGLGRRPRARLVAGTDRFGPFERTASRPRVLCTPVLRDEPPPPPPENRAPVIDAGPSVDPPTVDGGQPVALAVTAHDPDGDVLAYAWSQLAPAAPTGSFNDPGTRDPAWTAPVVSVHTAIALRVTITDGRGGGVQGTVTVTVQPAAPPGNRPPTITIGPTARPDTPIAGDAVALSIAAADPDGDVLGYAWTQVAPAAPVGVLSDPGIAAPAWRAPAVAARTDFTLRVAISDGRGGDTTGDIVVTVDVPSYAAHIQPIWTANCSAEFCHGGRFLGANLSLRPGGVRQNLINVPAQACGPLVRVLPGDPERSVLVRKITGTSCGQRMPLDTPGFFDANPGLLARITSWILSGAPDD
jgi:hypothetical protein